MRKGAVIMKICPNPACDHSFLYSDSKTECPFCHAALVPNGLGAGLPGGVVLNGFERESAVQAPEFVTDGWGRRFTCHGRVTEISHQELFYSPMHKLVNALFRGEPFQFAHQTVEYTVRIEEIGDSPAPEIADFRLFGNYMGCLQPGDEVILHARKHRTCNTASGVYNVTSESEVRSGMQIPAWLIRVSVISLLAVVLFLGLMLAGELSKDMRTLGISFASAVADRRKVLDSIITWIVLIGTVLFILRSHVRRRRRRHGWWF